MNTANQRHEIVKSISNVALKIMRLNSYDFPISYACVISDATACCAEGIEFKLSDNLIYPDDYPELGSEITVIGEFQPYEENGIKWYHLVNAKIL